MPSSPPSDRQPLLPAPVTAPSAGGSSGTGTGTGPPPSRTRLSGRRLPGLAISERARGKQRAFQFAQREHRALRPDDDDAPNREGLEDDDELKRRDKGRGKTKKKEMRGRHVTIIFSNEAEVAGGNLEIWVDEGETVGSVKDQIRYLRPALAPLSLRLIHAGRLLTDGILLLPWLRSLEERVRRQAAGVGGDVESVLKEVGLADDEDDNDEDAGIGPGTRADPAGKEKGKGKDREGKGKEDRVWLHCNVGARMDVKKEEDKEEEEPVAPRRRGFDALLDAGLSPADVAQMRRQFYESRGEEVPEGLEAGDVNDEHARALEEQWIEGDLTAETATTSAEGMYTSILHGLLTGFLFPLIPIFWFRELPLPNFFDAEAEAIAAAGRSASRSGTGARAGGGTRGTAVGGRGGSGGGGGGGGAGGGEGSSESSRTLPIFGKRMRMGIVLGMIVNFAFGALRFLN
ncbi:hypothetical protein EHS25_010119 [Saitozyma podzolica]|uniref:Ubiquitin-like domain-containing protein n=1 Tax=Saitozyma podzolica TaxID=1890683 RepID=A0A427YIP7_9TREE|nr:hypothetical protein EHS25_010119 [Saitozyma podzolica]